MKTIDILWQSIKDIENGDVDFISRDPLNGFLTGKNKHLTKVNISDQSAKYTKNNKPITRPTIDSYDEIIDYLSNMKGSGSKKENEKLKEENKKLKKEKELLTLENKKLKSMNTKLAENKFIKSVN